MSKLRDGQDRPAVILQRIVKSAPALPPMRVKAEAAEVGDDKPDAADELAYTVHAAADEPAADEPAANQPASSMLDDRMTACPGSPLDRTIEITEGFMGAKD